MTSRLFRGGDKGGSAADFDPVAQGQCHGLSPEIARELWDGIVRESTGSDGRVDPARARERFEEVARRVASRRAQSRATPGKGAGADRTDDRRAIGAAHAALAPGKVTLVETEGHHALAPELPDVDGVPALLASGAPTARSAPARASRKAGSTHAATSGASRGRDVATLDVEALERRAVMLGVLPFVTPRWKQLGGALFSSDEKPAAPLSPEAFAARAYGLVLASPLDLFTAQVALSGPGREAYALALQKAMQLVLRDRPILEKLQSDIEYLTRGGDLESAATRIIANHALASPDAKNALKEQGALAADSLAAYIEDGAVTHGIKFKRSELLANGVAPFYAESMALAGGPARLRAVQALAKIVLTGAAPAAVAETHQDSEVVKAEANALATMIRKALANHRTGERLSTDEWNKLDVALGAASPRARDLVWANAEVTGLLARALDPGQAKKALGTLDTVEALYESVRTTSAQAAPVVKLAYGPPLPPPTLAAQNPAYPAIVAWLAERPGEGNRALRNRLLQHVKLKTEVLDRLPAAQQRLLYRVIANGTLEPTAEDRLHEAAEQGRGPEVVKALRELASANPRRLAELERDASFRASIERMRETIDVDGIPLRPYDVCLTLWGRDPRENIDPLLGAQRQVNLTGNKNPLSIEERLKLDDELFNPALADIHAQVANRLPKPRFAQMYASALNPLPRAQAVLDRLRVFERKAAQEEFKHLLQREQIVAGAELGKRFGKRWSIDLRTWVYENGGPHIRSGVARILGSEHGASVGTFNGETVSLGEALPDKITLQQALRETASGAEGWTVSEWCSVVSRDMARAIEARSKQKVLDAWRRLDFAISNVEAELERLTGRRIRTIDLLRNAMLEHGGHLEARIAERFSTSDRDELCDALGIVAANREDAAHAPTPDAAQLANETYAAPAKQLWACLSALHAGSSMPEYVALGGLLTMVRHLPRLDASGAADPHAVEEHPPRSFAAYYRAQYGTSVDGHVEAVLRAMPDKKRVVPVSDAARLLGLDPQRLASLPQNLKEELSIDEHNAHLVRAEFTVEDARGRARQIWQILHGSGRLETISKQLYGDCNDEEQRLIRVAFRQLSGGYDLTFYLRQAIDAQQRRTADSRFDGTLRSVPLPFAGADHHVGVGAMGSIEGVQATLLGGSAGMVHVHGTASELDRALSVATVGEVDIKTRLRAAAARDNVDHVFRTIEDASPAERTAILADGALVNRLKALGQWQWERCYKVLTNQADLADRLYSRSHGDGGLLESTFGGTHEGGMKEDLKGNATRLRLKYDAEVRAEIAHLLEKPEQREIDREVNRRVLEAAGINAADRSVDAILHSELSGNELAEMKAMVRNAGTARDWAVACGGGAKSILAEIRGLSAQQRAAKLRDPQYLKLLADRLSNEKDYRDALNTLGATVDADVTHGGGALARLDEASRSSAQVNGAERDRGKTLRALSELSPQEYARLRADPQLQLQIFETLSPDERALARDMLAFAPAHAPEPDAGDMRPAPTPAAPHQLARELADFFVHQSVGRLRVACLRSWRDVLVQAAEVYKLDFALGFAKRGTGGHGEAREAPSAVNAAALRTTIWQGASPAVRAFAKEHQDHPGKKTRDAITGAQMIGIVQAAVLATSDPSDALVAENILTVDEKAGGDAAAANAMREMVGADAAVDAAGLADTLRAASDKHVAEQWTSIRRSPAGNTGDTMQARYREVVATEAAAKAHLATTSAAMPSSVAVPGDAGDAAAATMPALPGRASAPATYAAAPQVDDPVLRAAAQARRRFLEYQIKIAQALEDMLLPYMGDDRRATQAPVAGEQQTSGRDNKRYNDLAEIILERIPQLPPEVIAATLGMKKEHTSLLSSSARRHAGEVYLRDQRDLRYRGEQNSAGSVAQDEKEILDEEQTRLARHHAQAITDGDVTAAEDQEYDRRYDAVDRAHEAHQAAKQAVASWASLIVGTVVTIAATVLTGGLATGPVAMMALAGATAALSATAKSLVMEEILEGEWDREDAARMIATEVITGLVTMGTTYYAQRLLAAASGAATFAKQGAAVRQVLRRPPRLYQSLAHEAAEEMVSETMSGIVEAGLEAIDSTHWMHGYEEGAHSAKQAALARLSQVDDNALQGGVTAILTSVGGRIMKRARRGGGHVGPDAHALDVPAKDKKRVDVVRNLKATLGDPGEKFMEALVQWGMQQDGPINWAGAPSELLRGWIEEMGEAGVEMHTGTVHKSKRDARAKAEIDRAQGTVPKHELDDYARMQEGALDTDVFVSLDEHQRIRETVIHQGLSDTEARGGFALTPAQRHAFVAWVRANAPRSDELVHVAATDPRTIPEVMNAASPAPAEPAAHERATQQMPAVAAHERTTEQMPAVAAHERTTEQMPAVAAHDRTTQQMPAVAAHERTTQPMAVVLTRALEQNLPDLTQLASLPADVLGAHQRGAVESALLQLDDAQYEAFRSLHSMTPSPIGRGFLYKALAAGNGMENLQWLAWEIQGKDDNWLLDNLTLGDPRGIGVGLAQQLSMSCNAAVTLTLRGNYDPVFALGLRKANPDISNYDAVNPTAFNEDLTRREQTMLESSYQGQATASGHGGVAAPRAAGETRGRWADDLLNAQADATGLAFTTEKGISGSRVVFALEAALDEGMQVPVVLGSTSTEHRHYVLVTAIRRDGDGSQFRFFNTSSGKSIWVHAKDILDGTLPFDEGAMVTALETPVAHGPSIAGTRAAGTTGGATLTTDDAPHLASVAVSAIAQQVPVSVASASITIHAGDEGAASIPAGDGVLQSRPRSTQPLQLPAEVVEAVATIVSPQAAAAVHALAGKPRPGGHARDAGADEFTQTWRDADVDLDKFKEQYGPEYEDAVSKIERVRAASPEVAAVLRNVPQEELVALVLYTSTHFYEWNRTLRAKDRDSLEDVGAGIKLASAGLEKMPVSEGWVHRGVTLSDEQIARYVPGETITEEAFVSTSRNEEGAYGGNARFRVLSKTGRRVDVLSRYDAEAEVLFRPGTRFVVTDKMRDGDVVVISLEEVVEDKERSHEDAAPLAPESSGPGGAVRPTGAAGPDLHSHMMGVLDVEYFIQKLGGGSASDALRVVHQILSSDAAAQKSAKHAWRIAQVAQARVAALAAAGASAEEVDASAGVALTQMLSAGEETPFDKTYPIRTVLVENVIDTGGGSYRNYARDTLRALADEGIGYSEQSVGLDKLEKLPKSMMDELQAELATDGQSVDVRFLAMVSTRALSESISGVERGAVLATLERVLGRGDVIGVDIAGPEKGEFTLAGMENFGALYAAVSAAAHKRNRALVLRPHVGEGYNEGNGPRHVEVARKNLDTLISALQRMGYSSAKAATDKVLVRLGHATHATVDQLSLLAGLGVTVEANLGSNLVTRSIVDLGEHPLLFNLYYGIETVLGTDGGGVMGSARKDEYARARDLIAPFVDGLSYLKVGNDEVWFRDLPPDVQARFSVEALQRAEDAHYARIKSGDAADRARAAKDGDS